MSRRVVQFPADRQANEWRVLGLGLRPTGYAFRDRLDAEEALGLPAAEVVTLYRAQFRLAAQRRDVAHHDIVHAKIANGDPLTDVERTWLDARIAQRTVRP